MKISALAALWAIFAFAVCPAIALTVLDTVVYKRNCWLVTWTDLQGKQRKAALVNSGDHRGICQFFSYYAGTAPVTVKPQTPDLDPLNSGFGSTCHHEATMYAGGTITKRFQGDAMVVFDWVQNIDGAAETVTYTFMDGHDYFQWAETMNTKGGAKAGDSRGPYCTINWEGSGNPAEGVEYGAKRYFKQPVLTGPGWPSRSGPYTFGGTCDIPYAWEWADGREIGYIATQTFTQQNQGAPALSELLPASADALDPNGNDVWKMDYQMNFYDEWLKITWGQPFGWTNNSGDATAQGCLKNGWGQYSLSIVLDAKADSGVMRVRDENRLIHGGAVVFSAIQGTVKMQGPVGTVNPAQQTLSPAGYDHNYRAWWVTAVANKVALGLNISGATASLQSPVVRVSGMTASPSVVALNETLLSPGKNCYVSWDSAAKEAWVCIAKKLTGINQIIISHPTQVAATPEKGVTMMKPRPSADAFYDCTGRRVAAGSHTAGIYIVRRSIPGAADLRRIVLIR